jgi:hypothetical protein
MLFQKTTCEKLWFYVPISVASQYHDVIEALTQKIFKESIKTVQNIGWPLFGVFDLFFDLFTKYTTDYQRRVINIFTFVTVVKIHNGRPIFYEDL